MFYALSIAEILLVFSADLHLLTTAGWRVLFQPPSRLLSVAYRENSPGDRNRQPPAGCAERFLDNLRCRTRKSPIPTASWLLSKPCNRRGIKTNGIDQRALTVATRRHRPADRKSVGRYVDRRGGGSTGARRMATLMRH